MIQIHMFNPLLRKETTFPGKNSDVRLEQAMAFIRERGALHEEMENKLAKKVKHWDCEVYQGNYLFYHLARDSLLDTD